MRLNSSTESPPPLCMLSIRDEREKERNGGLTSAVHWWEESQLRVLILSSMAIQIFLLFFAFLRKYAIPRYLRSIVWLAYLAGDAVAIYALATLFNRHKTDDHQHLGGGSPSMLELIWVPILLIHLGGNDNITAYNIEDNELWSRHVLTAVSQVTVAIYVFKNSWPTGGDKKLRATAIMLFIAGVLKCFVKPWALKRASIYSLVSLDDAKQKEEKMYTLHEYVKQGKEKIVKKEAAFVREQNYDEAEAQRAKWHKEPAGTIRSEEQITKIISLLLRIFSKDEEGAPTTQGSFCGRIREALKDRERLAQERTKYRREMLQQRREVRKQFVDLSSTYSRRLSILGHFWGLREETAYGSVRQGLATAFFLLYTKVKTTDYNMDIAEESSISFPLRLVAQVLMVTGGLRAVIPCVSIGIFRNSQKELALNDIDVKITYAILCCTAVLETTSYFIWAVARGAKKSLRDAWPEMVAQYSLIGYFARSKRHRSWMWAASFFQCKDFLDQHWCMKSCFSSSRKISELVLQYLKDGWKNQIDDATSYRRFNDHNSRWVLERREECSSQVPSGSTGQRMNRTPLPFDECVLLWHSATDFCFFFSSSFSVSEQISDSAAEVPTRTILTRITEINQIRRGGRSRVMVSKVLPEATSSSVDGYGQIKSQCRQMSNYMVYLLFVNPEMLLPGTRRKLFTAAYNDLRGILRRDNKFAVSYKEIKDILMDKKQNVCTRVRTAMKEVKEILRDSNRNPMGWSQWKPAPVKKKKIMKRVISTMLYKSKNKASEKELKKGCEVESEEERPRQENFIEDAWSLSQGLLELGHELGDEKMWEVIQGVWVEMLCYSASRCRGYLHAKALGNGGEFLSYIWLLLFHMGMETFTDKLQREEPPSHGAGNGDMDDLNQEEDSICADRLQREDPPSHGAWNNDTDDLNQEEDSIYADRLQREDPPRQGGNKNNGIASTPTFEICEAGDNMV